MKHLLFLCNGIEFNHIIVVVADDVIIIMLQLQGVRIAPVSLVANTSSKCKIMGGAYADRVVTTCRPGRLSSNISLIWRRHIRRGGL